MEVRCCVSCGRSFNVRPQTPNQTYCTLSDCQRLRRRRWQQAKLKSDPDYRDNQARAQKNWLSRQPDYWQKYRTRNPKYADHNRALQRRRSLQIQTPEIAKMDASNPSSLLTSGIYRISLVDPDAVAKMDSWIVEITVLSDGLAPPGAAKKLAKR